MAPKIFHMSGDLESIDKAIFMAESASSMQSFEASLLASDFFRWLACLKEAIAKFVQ